MRRKILFSGVAFILLSFHSVPLFSQTIPVPWSWPITSDYGPRNVGSWFHKGIDYGGPEGADIPAVEGGTIVAIAYGGGWYIAVLSAPDKRWTYLHIFDGRGPQTDPLPRISGNWQLINATLHDPITQDTDNSNVIILWSNRTLNQAQKVLCVSQFNNRRVLIDGNPVNGIDGNEIRSQGSVASSESVAPVGNSGPAGTPVHLHLGLNYGDDNPLLHLTHPPDILPTATIENPPNNHVFTQSELNSNYPIKVRINSVNGLDFDKLSLWIYRNNDPNQAIRLGTDPTFGYGGRTGENKTATVVESAGATTGVQPIGTIPGDDRFIYLQNFGSLNLPDGTHSLVVKGKDVNDHDIKDVLHQFTINTPPPEISGNSFKIEKTYSFPNPAKLENPIFRIALTDVADRINIQVFNMAAERVYETELFNYSKTEAGRYIYEHTWDVNRIASGVYICLIRGYRGSQESKFIWKLAIIR